MRNLLICILAMFPMVAMADVDVSNCEVVGYQTSRVTEKACQTKEKCEESFAMHNEQKKFDACMAEIKTPEQCAQFIQEQDDIARKMLLIYKCPVTDVLLQRKNADKDIGTMEKYAYNNDGTPIDTTAMITDSENVYLFLNTPLLGMRVTENSKLRYYIIGPAGEDNMMFTWLPED